MDISYYYYDGIKCCLLQRVTSYLPPCRLQEAESNRLCRRLQLKDIIPVEMQRLTKYPLLLDNIAKYTGEETWRPRGDDHWLLGGFFHRRNLFLGCVSPEAEDGDEREKVKKAGECCKKILNHVNQAVKEAENKQVRARESSSSFLLWFLNLNVPFANFQRFNRLRSVSTEAGGLPEEVRSVLAQTEWEPHDPGAAGEKRAAVSDDAPE